MNNTSAQKECLEKILNSNDFTGSKTYQSYLKYLVDASENNKHLKETTIAIEFFGKSADFNPAQDTIVRSHTYKLRKKLETYYLKGGKEDRIRLRIPKGHYEVTFVPFDKNDANNSPNLNYFSQNKYYLLAITILSAVTLLLWNHNRTLEDNLQRYQVISGNTPIWKDYLQSELPILIAIGDHFFFTEYSDNYQNLLAIRDGKINSLEDLEALKSLYPNQNLQSADEPYFPYHSIWSLPPILSILYSHHLKPVLRKSSAISPQILDEYNIIFIGSIKTLYILKHTLSKSNFQFEISPHKVLYSPADSNSSQLFKTSLHSTGPNDDLVLALKLPGPVNNSIFIIASFHSLGAPQIANYLTNPKTLSELESKLDEKYDRVPQYFELLFRVTGIDKTAYNTELLIYNEIIQ